MRQIVLVSHGSPSDPAPLDAGLKSIAARVQALCPEHQIRGATLALPGALEAALSGFDAPEIYPFFMAEGWFTRQAIPARLAAAGLHDWRVLAPFGVAARVQDLAMRLAEAAGVEALILAAHGSFKSAGPALIAEAVAAQIRARTAITRVEVGFIDQAPQLSSLRGLPQNSACLPFFAMAGGHVTEDLPQALADAGFAGRILPALGLHDEVPELIAQLLHAADASPSFAENNAPCP